MSGYQVGLGKAPKQQMKSPARDVQAFDEACLDNGPVPKVGLVTGNPGTTSLPQATGRPRAVQEADGTASPRTETQTKQAAAPTTPSGGANRNPSGVQSFKDGL